MIPRPFRILKIDLSSGTDDVFDIPEGWKRDFIGGAGLAARLLYDHLTGDLDPFAQHAPLLLLSGPLTGTIGPATGRFAICAKSPATGLWGESNIGGFFGPEMRAAGYDGIWLTGKAPKPSYVFIREGAVEIRKADHLWGSQDTYSTQTAVQDEVGKRAKVLCIGYAGEQRLKSALILSDHGRVAGRTGMGAVMGSKNLKAVAARGSREIPLYDRKGYAELRARANRDLREDNQSVGLRQFGTGSGSEIFDYFGMMPKKYFSASTLQGCGKIAGTTMAETILTGVSTCHGCVIACGRKVRLKKGPERKGPEYETIIGFGPNVGIVDLEAATRLGELCDQYGIDTISISNTIGLAILMYERGYLTKKDTDGLELEWGKENLIRELIFKIVNKEGFGAELAQGARHLAGTYGAPDLVVQVNGLEVPYHDPRGGSGMALVYATSPRGACHNQSHYYMVEIGQTNEEVGVEIFPRDAGPEKALNVAHHQNWDTLANSLVMCIFANTAPQMVCDLVNSAMGEDYSLDTLLQVGERAWNLKRRINYRLGLRKEDDRLPPHLLQPRKDEPAESFNPILFDAMLAAYYQARGWDASDGQPTEETMKRLGLSGI